MIPIPTSLLDFQRQFPNEAACAEYMLRMRWPSGFVCPKCGAAGVPRQLGTRPWLLRCRACLHETSLTAGTIMHGTRTPLHVWFWAAYLVTTQTPGMSALQVQKQLGIHRYESAFQLMHKLRAVMVRPDRDRIGGHYPVECDETLIGGKTRGEGRGVHHKVYVVGAVEVRETRAGEARASEGGAEHEGGVPLKQRVYAGRLRLRMLADRTSPGIQRFVADSVDVGSTVRTDGYVGYQPLRKLGYFHEAVVQEDDPKAAETHLPMIHLVFSNLKTWILGTHHGVSQTHLQAYLNEFTFRFNRRFYPMTSFASVLGLGAATRGPTYEGLYGGQWEHPNRVAKRMVAGKGRR